MHRKSIKNGCVLLNFDANYGAVDFTDTSDLPKNHAHNQIENTLMQECEDIKRQLSISNYARPAWDLEALSNSGVQQFRIDVGVSQRVYMEKMHSIIRLHCLQSVEKKGTYDQYQTVKIFYHLCRCRLFQRGGICFVYDPVQCKVIRSLEEEMQASLFVRSPHGIGLTPNGKQAYAYASRVLENVEAMAELSAVDRKSVV